MRVKAHGMCINFSSSRQSPGQPPAKAPKTSALCAKGGNPPSPTAPQPEKLNGGVCALSRRHPTASSVRLLAGADDPMTIAVEEAYLEANTLQPAAADSETERTRPRPPSQAYSTLLDPFWCVSCTALSPAHLRCSGVTQTHQPDQVA